EDVQQFIHQNYQTNDIVIGITGDYELKTEEKMLRRYFEPVKENKQVRPRQGAAVNVAAHIELTKPINQVHYMLGAPAYSIRDDRKTGLLLLNNMLGGFGMTSILNLAVREKYGIAYTIESNYTLLTAS